MSDKMRELFEKWAIDNGHSIGKYVNEFHQGEYLSEYTAFAWMAWQAAQSAAVPVVGEPTDAAYKWLIAHGVEPMASLHKLGKRLAGLLDEDQFAECELLLSKAITEINAFVPVPAAELATLREKAAMADELRKDAERYRWIRSSSVGPATVWHVCMVHLECGLHTLKSDHCLDAAIDAAIAGEKK